MRIAVNARRLAGQRLGIGRYIEYLLKYWKTMLLPSEDVTLYLQEAPTESDRQLVDRYQVGVLKPNLMGVFWENLLLPAHSSEHDVFFGPSYTVPLAYRGRCVVATHSVNEAQPGAHPWWYNFSYTPWYRYSAQKADRVIVPSESTRADVQKFYGIPADKIDIVQEGVDDAFRPLNDEKLVQRVRQQYFGSDRPYILFVGKLSQRRSIPALMAAFSALKKRYQIPHGLLLVGPNHLGLPLDKLARELDLTDSLVQTDGKFPDHSELISIYNAADLYVYPSLYDGFSLTTVEALACGVPVVTVNRAALREIAGGCSLLVDEPTADALATAMHQALFDQGLRQELRAKGLARAHTLRWEETARKTLEVLRRVAGN